MRERAWLVYLRDKAISNTFLGRPVLAGVDWRMKAMGAA